MGHHNRGYRETEIELQQLLAHQAAERLALKTRGNEATGAGQDPPTYGASTTTDAIMGNTGQSSSSSSGAMSFYSTARGSAADRPAGTSVTQTKGKPVPDVSLISAIKADFDWVW